MVPGMGRTIKPDVSPAEAGSGPIQVKIKKIRVRVDILLFKRFSRDIEKSIPDLY